MSNFYGYCYDGQIAGDMLVSSDKNDKYTYSLKTRFDSVSMGKFLAKPGADPNVFSSGVMKGLLAVKGLLGEKTSRTGSLTLSIVGMRAGRMSLMAKILTLLSFTVPGDVAFYGLDMDSQIKGEEMIVEKLKMSGEALLPGGRKDKSGHPSGRYRPCGYQSDSDTGVPDQRDSGDKACGGISEGTRTTGRSRGECHAAAAG